MNARQNAVFFGKKGGSFKKHQNSPSPTPLSGLEMLFVSVRQARNAVCVCVRVCAEKQAKQRLTTETNNNEKKVKEITGQLGDLNKKIKELEAEKQKVFISAFFLPPLIKNEKRTFILCSFVLFGVRRGTIFVCRNHDKKNQNQKLVPFHCMCTAKWSDGDSSTAGHCVKLRPGRTVAQLVRPFLQREERSARKRKRGEDVPSERRMGAPVLPPGTTRSDEVATV